MGGLTYPQQQLEIPTTLPTPQETQGIETQTTPTTTPTTEGVQTGSLSTPIQTQPTTTKQTTLTGYTPEQLYAGAMKAYKAGDKSSYNQLKSMYDDETSYQEKQAKKKTGGTEASIGMMEKLYGAGTNKSLSMGSKTTLLGGGVQARAKTEYKKLKDQDFVDRLNTYKTQMALVAGAINQAAGAGVLNGGEYERLAMKSFPNEYTSETVAKQWFSNARSVLESIPADRASELSTYLQGL
jgi:hypothetical protein